MGFGEDLRRIRESRSLTVNQLALYSNISAATISRIENGKRGAPKPHNIEKLSEALKYPYEDLMRLAGYLPEGVAENTATYNVRQYDDIMQEIKNKYPGVDLNDPDIRRKLMKMIDLVLDDYEQK
jgi:transcriptional regulator with XRE-family HTH domain